MRLFRALVICCVVSAAIIAYGQQPFSGAIRITSAFPVGSGPDVVVRQIAERLAATAGSPVIVDAKPGAGGVVAAVAAKSAAPGGRELLFTEAGQLTIAPSLAANAPLYDLERDFQAVAQIARTPFYVAVAANGPYKTFADIVKAAKASPGKVSFGSSGIGTPLHLGGAQIEIASGIKMQHVPYRDAAQLYQSVASGDLDWAFGTIGSTNALVKAGKLRFIAIVGPRRNAQLPEVPTLAESGGPSGIETMTLLVLVAPAGTSAQTAARLNESTNAALRQPDLLNRLEQMGYEAAAGSRDELASALKTEAARYGELIKRTGVKAE